MSYVNVAMLDNVIYVLNKFVHAIIIDLNRYFAVKYKNKKRNIDYSIPAYN